MHRTAGGRGVGSFVDRRRGGRVRREFAHLPALDGLRALAVVAVVLYHADVTAVSGGFLGVEVFLVISGYLIASLLLHALRPYGGEPGTVDLRRFWIGRVRRLAPAVVVLVVGCLSLAAVTAHDAIGPLRRAVVGALTFTSNWWQILQRESYFVAAGRPPMLRHLWSLGVEMQFYAVVPLVLVAVAPRIRRRTLFACAAAGAVVSTLLMALLFEPGADPSRVFYGTDTRASGLLVGVALAVVWPAQDFRPTRVGRTAQRSLDVTGGVALVVLLVLFLTVNEFDPFVYRGGFLLVDLAAMVLIAAAVHPAGRLVGMLGVRPLAWLGRRSYSLYLWHWPVVVLTRPDLDVDVHGVALLALRLGVSLVLADLSYRFVEGPFRAGALERVLAPFARPSSPRQRRRARAFVGFAAASAVLSVAIAVWPATDGRVDVLVGQRSVVIDTTTVPTSPTVPTTLPGAAPVPTAPPTTTIPDGVLAVGDSVLAGAEEQLRVLVPGVSINAEISRSCGAAVRIVERAAAAGLLPRVVVVHTGTNGPCRDDDLERLVAATGGRRLVLVNVAAPRPWESLANDRLAAAADRSGATLADWHRVAAGHGDWFVADRVHLTPAGRLAFAELVRERIG